jgi:DeoR/GlpR family transcriptional regulator of sugar metabolism
LFSFVHGLNLISPVYQGIFFISRHPSTLISGVGSILLQNLGLPTPFFCPVRAGNWAMRSHHTPKSSFLLYIDLSRVFSGYFFQELSRISETLTNMKPLDKTVDAQTKTETKKNPRRQLIFRRVVLENRPLPLNELRELLDDKVDEGRIRKDLESFAAVGCKIELQPCTAPGETKQLVFAEGPHTDDDTMREKHNLEQKNLVARLAVSLICGAPEPGKGENLAPWMFLVDQAARKALDRMTIHSARDKKIAGRVKSVLTKIRTQAETFGGQEGIFPAKLVLDLVKKSNSFLKTQQDSLKRNLYRFWEESSRLIAVDSGTTNIQLSRILKKLPIPLVGSPLASLMVCTNSRKIFEVLGPSDVWVKTIIIGGQQKFRSPTIAGAMAEIFLRSVSILQFGMCILGSTRVDLDRFALCSDSQEESSIKNLIMDRSSLRVICVDDSKLQSGPGREGYRFASIDPRQIDLILTNCPLQRAGQKAKEEYVSFLAKIESIESRGVPVLVATSEKTFDYPNVDTSSMESKHSE